MCQVCNHELGNFSVLLPHHPHAIRPACPMRGTAGTECTGKAQPPAENDKVAMTWATGTPRISHRHPDIMAVCEVSRVLGNHCPQPEIGTGGTTHEEEEACCLWVAAHTESFGTECLARGPPSQDTLVQLLWLTTGQLPGPFTPSSLNGNSVSPPPYHNHRLTNLAASMSSSILLVSKLVSCRSAFGCERVPAPLAPQMANTAPTRSGVHTAQTSSKKAISLSPTLSRACAAANEPCCPKANNMGITGSPCSPASLCGMLGDAHLVFPQTCGWAAHRNTSPNGGSDLHRPSSRSLPTLRLWRPSDRTRRLRQWRSPSMRDRVISGLKLCA